MACPKASIIITTYNQVELTTRCLESIAGKTAGPEYEVIVVDNHSTDNTPGYLRAWAAAHPNTHLILNEANAGFPAANNQAVRQACGSILVFLNNDTVVTSGWLETLVGWLRDPAIGMVGPVTNASGNETLIEVTYADLTGLDDFAERYTRLHAGESFEIRMLPFHCVAMRREVFDRVGPLEEHFGVGMFEDDDYAMRVRQQGLKLICAEDVFIHHVGGASFYRLSRGDYWRIWQENRRFFEQKWGITWHPPRLRPALLPRQVDQLLDAMVANAIELAQKDQELQEIHASTAWKLIRWLWRVRLALIPHGSRRDQLARKVIQWARKRLSPSPGHGRIPRGSSCRWSNASWR